MSTRTFALVWGVAFLLAGAAGFVLATPPHPGHPPLVIDSFYGQALGLFPVNILHNIVHLAFGVWGLLAYKSISAAKTYAKSVAIIYFVFAIAGLIPGLNTMFGLVPLYGNDVWLHLLLGGVAAYFGWMHRDVAGPSART